MGQKYLYLGDDEFQPIDDNFKLKNRDIVIEIPDYMETEKAYLESVISNASDELEAILEGMEEQVRLQKINKKKSS